MKNQSYIAAKFAAHCAAERELDAGAELVALRNAALAYVHTRLGGDGLWSVPEDPEKEAQCAYWLKVFEEKIGRDLGGKIVLRKFPINQIHSEWRLAFETLLQETD